MPGDFARLVTPSLVAELQKLNLRLRGASKSFGESQMEYFARRKKVSGLDTFEQTREEKHGPRCVGIAGTLGRAGSRRL